jgi:hypothetical protein
VVPSVVGGALVASNLCVRAHCPRDAAAAVAYIKAQRAENSREEGVILHTPAAAALVDEFEEQPVWIKSDGLVCGVVESEVLERDVAGVVASEVVQEREPMFFCVGSGGVR